MIFFKVSNDESLVRKYTLMCLDLLKMSCASRLECFLRSTQIYLFLFNTKIMNCINKNKTSPNCLNVLKHEKKSIKLSPHWKRCESYVLDLENIIYFPEMGGGGASSPLWKFQENICCELFPYFMTWVKYHPPSPNISKFNCDQCE